MSTFMQKPSQVERKWYIIDAAGKPMGRVAAQAAILLRGKHKPTYTPHVDGGDFVVVTNADKFVVTGNKMLDKKYYRHSGYPGGLKTRSLEEMLDKKPTEVIRIAVKNMLPKNKLGREMINRLKIYKGTDHRHDAQKPEKIEL